jgi:hypothetical protein
MAIITQRFAALKMAKCEMLNHAQIKNCPKGGCGPFARKIEISIETAKETV